MADQNADPAPENIREDITGPLAGDAQTQELTISAEKVCYFIIKAREFEAKDQVTEPDPGSNPTDDGMIAVLEDHGDDPVQEELQSFIASLTEDDEVELVALMWLGRGDGTFDDWPSLRAEALRVHGSKRSVSTARYLLGTPLAGDYVEEALSMFGQSCSDDNCL